MLEKNWNKEYLDTALPANANSMKIAKTDIEEKASPEAKENFKNDLISFCNTEKGKLDKEGRAEYKAMATARKDDVNMKGKKLFEIPEVKDLVKKYGRICFTCFSNGCSVRQ